MKAQPGHEGCRNYKTWKTCHPIDASDIIRKSHSSFRSAYVPLAKVIVVHGKDVQIKGGIKSLDPPCLEEASSFGDHPYTCVNCESQMRERKDILRHRNIGTCNSLTNRIGHVGFNKRYARKGELSEALANEVDRRKTADKQVSALLQVKLSPLEWENQLQDSCRNGDDQKLITDLARLFRSGISKTQPVQVIVIKNLVSKLLKANNHHYVDIIKNISSLFKNQLGSANYAILSELFGLARESTAAKHTAGLRLGPGINQGALDKAESLFKNAPVNEASDGARSLRYLQPFMTTDGEIVLLGKSWDPDVNNWSEEILPVPRRNRALGDVDDFEALKRTIDDMLRKEQLSKSVSVHNLVSLASLDEPTVIYCMWPERNKGYKACHLLKYWENLRHNCFYDHEGKPRASPIRLVGYSTDSAGFSLAAAVQMMTPTLPEVKAGVHFLGLGTEDERYCAPYYWFLPSIAYLDYDHEQRLFLKNLKYETRDLTFWEGEGSETRVATIQHLKDLRQRCGKAGMDTGISAVDLVLIYFFDQNSDACERIFTQRIADLLDEYVPGSQGTSLFVRAVTHLVEPIRNPAFGSPADVQKSVSCAITIFRLWKKALELKKIRLHSQPGANSTPSKRGHFLTHGCYQTAEIQFAAASIHQLAMFRHFKDLGPQWASPYRSGTKVTERIISEMQGKTNQIQSLDSEPTFVDMLQKSSSVQFNLNAKVRLAHAGVDVKASAKRRRVAFALKKHKAFISGFYSYPETFHEFLHQQRQAHFDGKREGQLLFSRYMPTSCIQLLKKSGVWETPYRFTHPKGLQLVHGLLPDVYNKLNLTFRLRIKHQKQELQMIWKMKVWKALMKMSV